MAIRTAIAAITSQGWEPSSPPWASSGKKLSRAAAPSTTSPFMMG
jgi:hypothetical protein